MSQQSLPQISVICCAIEPAGTAYIFPFLKSVYDSAYPKSRLQVIVQNNGIDSISKRKIRQEFPNVLIIGNGKNLNFATGINAAGRKATGTWIFVVNIDTQVDKNTFKYLINATHENVSIGIAAPIVYSLVNKKQLSNQDIPVINFSPLTGSVKAFSTIELEQLDRVTAVLWVSGCGFLIRRALWRKLNGFDEQFVAYWEDADLGIRASTYGVSIVIVPKARMWHYGSVVYGKNTPQKTYRLMRSSLYFTNKHTNVAGKIWTSIYLSIVCVVKLFKLIVNVDRLTQHAYLQAVYDHYVRKNLP